MSSNCATQPSAASVAINYPATTTDDFAKCHNSPANSESSAATPADSATDAGADLRSRIASLKRKFHRDRQLLVKHLPRNVVEPEIAQLLADFAVDRIQLSNADDKSSTATVTLAQPEVLDEWNGERSFVLRGHSVSVSPTPTEMVLCVAKLPAHYREANFHQLIGGFGEVRTHFLMISETTGASKGYGFVRYAHKESAISARNALNDKRVDSAQLTCDWLDSSCCSWRSLHSTCLYVDRLPTQFRDMGEFRAIFERCARPPYCQVALRSGSPLDWGLVEYLAPEDAELAQRSCDGWQLRNQPIRVLFYMPGVRAITAMAKLLETPTQAKSAGLLPDPSGQSIRTSIENLSKQNPIFAENLKNIILHQIHESKQPKELCDESKAAIKLEPKMWDVGSQQNDFEMIPPTPPMTPTIVNALPMMAAGLPAPIRPNMAVPPPPYLEKLGYAPNIGAKENYSIAWNKFAGQAQFTSGFVPAIQPATPDPANVAFAMRPTPAVTPLGANFAREILNLPPNAQQSILSIINNSSAAAVQPAAMQPVAFSPFASVDPSANWLLQKPTTVEASTLVSTPLATSIMTMPVVSEAVLPMWSVPSFMPASGGIPIFTSASTEWPGMQLHPQVVAAVSQPATPISYHPVYQQIHYDAAGQKRKLLPLLEKSPEGNYLGQHSQGISGHYANSYFKKKKMF